VSKAKALTSGDGNRGAAYDGRAKARDSHRSHGNRIDAGDAAGAIDGDAIGVAIRKHHAANDEKAVSLLRERALLAEAVDAAVIGAVYCGSITNCAQARISTWGEGDGKGRVVEDINAHVQWLIDGDRVADMRSDSSRKAVTFSRRVSISDDA